MKKFANAMRYTLYTVLLMTLGCTMDAELENTDNGNSDSASTRALSEGRFYYAFDEKVPLHEVADRVVVTFDKEYRSSVEERIAQSARYAKEKPLIREGFSVDYSVLTVGDKTDKKAFRDDWAKQTGVKSVRQVYALEEGYEMGYTDEIIVQFKAGASQQEIDAMHKKFGVEAVKTSELYVLLSVPAELDPLDVANAYQESGLTNYSYPNFIITAVSCQMPSDPYFNNQYYLRNTGQGVNNHFSTAGADINVVPVWNTITKGSPNIVVAVMDYQGFTPGHPDMPNLLTGRNFGGDPNNYLATDNNHGNACAGIIGAAHNGEGIAGIAPNCKILPVKVSYDEQVLWVDAIEFAADNADVISCSSAIGDANSFPSSNSNLYPAIVDAIRYATTSGARRGSKGGSVVVFAAGNTADRTSGNYGFVAFPANVNVPGVLAVGASDRDDDQAYYSPVSNPNSPHNQIIDVVAPSHKAYHSQIPTETLDVWTIDIPGSYGYNPTNPVNPDVYNYYGGLVHNPAFGTNYEAYTGHFGGTSAAAPQVAGVAALILSAHPTLTNFHVPNLSQKQVADIIEKTARKIGRYPATATRENGAWNSQIGYGVVNAYAAVSSAYNSFLSNWHIAGPGEAAWLSNTTYSFSSPPSSMTFNGWTITPNDYTTTSGTGNNTLDIIFGSSNQYTLKANFTKPDGSPYSLTKTVVNKIFSTPIISYNYENGEPAAAWTAKAFVFNVQTHVDYEWSINGSLVYSSPTFPTSILLPAFNVNDRFVVLCRARSGGAASDWSNALSIAAP